MQVGIDIQHADTERVERMMQSDRISKIFTEREIEYCSGKNKETLIGLFCAKEAFFKALGTGLKASLINGVEVRHNQVGAPYLLLSPEIIHDYQLSNAKISVSISHSNSMAAAVVIISKS